MVKPPRRSCTMPHFSNYVLDVADQVRGASSPDLQFAKSILPFNARTFFKTRYMHTIPLRQRVAECLFRTHGDHALGGGEVSVQQSPTSCGFPLSASIYGAQGEHAASAPNLVHGSTFNATMFIPSLAFQAFSFLPSTNISDFFSDIERRLHILMDVC